MTEPTGLVRDVHARNRRRRRAGSDSKVSWVVWAIVAAGLGLIVTIIIVCVRTMSHPGPGLVAADTLPTGQDVALSVSTFADGRAWFYRYVAAAALEKGTAYF